MASQPINQKAAWETKLRPLYDTERDNAWSRAREVVAGPEINEKEFISKEPGKYPAWIVILTVILSVIVLVAAFIPSAFRLYVAGFDTFCAAIDNGQCSTVGNATIVLSEIGQIVFFFCLAILGTSQTAKNVFWAGVILATSFAVVGNAYVSNPWEHGGYLFHYLETFGPPFLVMALGYVLKELLLYSIAARHQRVMEIAAAVQDRKKRLADPESFAEWNRAFSIALRDEIRRVNNRQREILSNLTSDEWRWLIKREMLAAKWTVDPNEQTKYEVSLVEQAVQAKATPPPTIAHPPLQIPRKVTVEKAPSEGGVQPTKARVITNTASEEQPEVWINGDGTWTAKSKRTGKVVGTEWPSESVAKNKLYRYHYALDKRKKSDNDGA